MQWISLKLKAGWLQRPSGNCQPPSVILLINYHNSLSNILWWAASLLPAACFVGVSFSGCDRDASVALMTIGTMFMAAFYCGFFANHIDIASNYSGTLLALTNTAATIPGFIVPVFVGELTHGNVINSHNYMKNITKDHVFQNQQQSLGQWQIIFFTTAAILCIECIAYTLMGSGEEQSWNRIYVSKGVSTSPEEEKLNVRRRPSVWRWRDRTII